MRDDTVRAKGEECDWMYEREAIKGDLHLSSQN